MAELEFLDGGACDWPAGHRHVEPQAGEAAAEALQTYLGVRPRTTNDAFFIGRSGARLSESALYKIVRSAIELADLKGRASPHTMRHSIATHLYENGADLLVIKEILGHARLAFSRARDGLFERRVPSRR